MNPIASFIKSYSTWIVVVALALSHLWMYRIGGIGPRADLASIKKDWRIYQEASKRNAKEAQNAYEMELANTRFAWDEWLRQHPKTAPSIRATVCADAPGNDIVSDAVSAYIEEVGQFRGEVESLLASADEQANQLNCTTDWAWRLNHPMTPVGIVCKSEGCP